MREISILTKIKVYASAEELPEEERRALNAAHEALELAYAPYSHFQVGAAALLEDGTMVLGANQENAAYPMCLCAERTALGTVATQYPEAAVKVLAITVRNLKKDIEKPAAPCGACRQVISETETRQRQPIAIILQGASGEIYVFDSAEGLLPMGFNGAYL